MDAEWVQDDDWEYPGASFHENGHRYALVRGDEALREILARIEGKIDRLLGESLPVVPCADEDGNYAHIMDYSGGA